MARLIVAPEQLESDDGQAALARLFSDAPPVAAALGLGAHAGGYPVRLREALADVFEVVARLLGDTEFAALSARFTAACPPGCYNLNDIGRGLARFLRDDPVTTRLPFLPDLAELEWKISRAFHAELVPAADTAGLGVLDEDDWQRVVLELQPGVEIVESPWPIRTLWEGRGALGQGSETGGGAETVLVYRRGLQVRLELVGAAEARALRAMRRGTRLSAALERAVQGGAIEAEAQAWPGRWQQLGLLSGWHLASP